MALVVTLIAYAKEDIEQRHLLGERHVRFYGGDITPEAERKETCSFDRGWVIAEILNQIICKSDGLTTNTELGTDCSMSGYAVTFDELLLVISKLCVKFLEEEDETDKLRLKTHIQDLVFFILSINWNEQVVYATS